ncbi:MAG: DUF4159 domain-containing protein [Lentisphaeria bacterium]|nr:DUF4159 domain-containing protein [Lentisphaeria bacterium]
MRSPLFPIFRFAGARVFAVWFLVSAAAAAGGESGAGLKTRPGPEIRVAQLVAGKAVARVYPSALPSLLTEIKRKTTLNVADQPVIIASFEDPAIFGCPFIHVNFGDRQDWTLSALEISNVKRYLEGGGFIHVDAGITAEFLRGDPGAVQQHSFADWRVNDILGTAFKAVFPTKSFEPLPRSHPLFRAFYQGLPDASTLPDTVRDFVVTEKWPEGTYSAVALKLDGRVAVLATPIISMGWGRNVNGGWLSTISFRVREGAPGLEERLAQAAYGGERFEVTREDQTTDVIFCQEPSKPAWVAESDGRYRVFRYYHSREISDFAHEFFTRLGVNIMVHAATE